MEAQKKKKIMSGKLVRCQCFCSYNIQLEEASHMYACGFSFNFEMDDAFLPAFTSMLNIPSL